MDWQIKSLCAWCLVLVTAGSNVANARQLTLGQTPGSVTIRRGSSVKNARPGVRLRQGDQVTTGGYRQSVRQQSKALINMDLDQGVILIGPNSTAYLSALHFYRNGAITEWRVTGRANFWASLRRFTNRYSRFVIHWPGGQRQEVRGTKFGADYDGTEGVLITKEGAIAVFDDQSSTAVAAGEGVIIKPDGSISEPQPVSQILNITGLTVEKKGAWIKVKGTVVVKHCILGNKCVDEPISAPKLTLFAKEYTGDYLGQFSLKTKPPVAGNSTLMRIQAGGRDATIQLGMRGLLPKHP